MAEHRSVFNHSVKYVLILAFVCLAGCSIALVSPHDEQLLAGTEMFYRKAAGVIERGISASPSSDTARDKILEPDKHAGHYSGFESSYKDLILDLETLLLRAIANDGKIDPAGRRLQEGINRIIETAIPSECDDASALFDGTSLTIKNFLDLKCIILKWKKQHSDPVLTRGSLILKKANWEGRKRIIFNAVLAIERAEGFKKENN
jgi:hypothetical protein